MATVKASLVVPVYRNEASIPDLVAALAGLAAGLPYPLEVVFVVDGSPDRSLERLASRLPEAPFASRLISLSRNFGAFPAIRAGLAAASGDVLAVMAADLQEPPSLAGQFFEILANEPVDVVIGQRQGRDDPALAQLGSRLFWRAYRRFVNPEMPPGGADVFGCTRTFRDHLLALDESHSSLVGLLFWLGFRRRFVPYLREARRHGTSAWTLRKKVTYLLDSVFAFTDLPIRLLMGLGALGIATSATIGAVIVVAHFAGVIKVPGYAATATMIAFFGALNLFGLGLVGSYAWRAYENGKRRPQSVVLGEMIFAGGGTAAAPVATAPAQGAPTHSDSAASR